MMNGIDGIQPVASPRAIEPTDAVGAGAAPAGLGEISDVVEISTAAILAAKVHELPAVRAELVARVRQEIEAGTYETQQRIDVTVQRIMEDMLGDL